MCFYADYDWFPSVQEKYTETSDGLIRCDECRKIIPVGASYTHIYQQQRDPDDWEPEDEEEEFDPGETFNYDCCDNCSRLLAAIEAEEMARGCTPHTSRPPLGEMREFVAELDQEDRQAYATRARAMFPGIDVPQFWDDPDKDANVGEHAL